jgi:hypothetical protein
MQFPYCYSARIWAVRDELKDSDNREEEVAGPVLFGHNARVWDCCICDSVSPIRSWFTYFFYMITFLVKRIFK